MPYKCLACDQEHGLDEVNHYDINGEQVANDEQSLERNAQNPDYAPHVICLYCDEARQDYNLKLVNNHGGLSHHLDTLRKLVRIEKKSQLEREE